MQHIAARLSWILDMFILLPTGKEHVIKKTGFNSQMKLFSLQAAGPANPKRFINDEGSIVQVGRMGELLLDDQNGWSWVCLKFKVTFIFPITIIQGWFSIFSRKSKWLNYDFHQNYSTRVKVPGRQDCIDGLIWSTPNLARLDGYPDIKVVYRTDWSKEKAAGFAAESATKPKMNLGTICLHIFFRLFFPEFVPIYCNF